MVHCTSGLAPGISRSIRVVRRHPPLAERLLVRMLFHDVGDEPVVNLGRNSRPHQAFEFVSKEHLRLHHENREEPRLHDPGVPEGQAQIVVALDLLRHLAHVARFHAEHVVSAAVLAAHFGGLRAGASVESPRTGRHPSPRVGNVNSVPLPFSCRHSPYTKCSSSLIDGALETG